MITTIFHCIYGKTFHAALRTGKQKSFGTNTVSKQTSALVISLEKPSVRNYRKVILVCSQFRYVVVWSGKDHSDTLKLILWRYHTKHSQNGRGSRDVWIKFVSLQWKSPFWTDYERIKILLEKDFKTSIPVLHQQIKGFYSWNKSICQYL